MFTACPRAVLDVLGSKPNGIGTAASGIEHQGHRQPRLGANWMPLIVCRDVFFAPAREAFGRILERLDVGGGG